MNAFRTLSRSIAVAACALAAAAWAQKTELLVYTALETDQLKAYTESFNKQFLFHSEMRFTASSATGLKVRFH